MPYAQPIITLNVYRSVERGVVRDCTNGGVSSQFNRLHLYRADVALGEIEPELRPSAVKLNLRVIGRPVWSVEPVVKCPSDRVGYMMGGNYAATSDSRLAAEMVRMLKAEGLPESYGRFYGALAIHDRTETVAQYRSYD